MTLAVQPELARALARIAELEANAELAAKCAAKREREHLANSDVLHKRVQELLRERGELVATIEEIDGDVVAARAEAIEVDQLRADAEREVADLTKEVEGLVEEKEKLEQLQAERDEEVYEDLAVAGDLLRDYLAATYSTARLPRELRALTDQLNVYW